MISKETFVDYMHSIKRSIEKDLAFESALKFLNKDGEGFSYIYSDEIDTMINMLCDIMGIISDGYDDYGDIISYFIYGTDWGKEKTPIEDKEGNSHTITTVEELYDYIVKYVI